MSGSFEFPRPLDDDLLDHSPYARAAFLLDELLELDLEQGAVLCSMRTDAPGIPLVADTRPLPGAGAHHLPGAVLVHLTGMMGLVHLHHIQACRYREGWIGYGVRIHRAEVVEPTRVGPPLLLKAKMTHRRVSAGRQVIRYHFHFHQDGRLVYLGDQTAIFQRMGPEDPLPLAPTDAPRGQHSRPTDRPTPLDAEFIRVSPYEPAANLIHEILSVEDEGLRARFFTDDRAALPFASFQRDPHGIHPPHVSGGTLYHLNQMMAVLFGHYVAGPSHRRGSWIHSFEVHKAEYRSLVDIGPPLYLEARRLPDLKSDDQNHVRLHCEFYQRGRLVYRGDQSARWVSD